MFERCLYFNTNALGRKLTERWEAAFKPYGLSPAHGYTLRLILSQPNLTQKEVADHMQLEKSTVTRFLTHLEKVGLVQRVRDDRDHRTWVVQPTAQAVLLYEELEDLGDELYRSMCDRLGEERVKDLVTTLRQVNASLS